MDYREANKYIRVRKSIDSDSVVMIIVRRVDDSHEIGGSKNDGECTKDICEHLEFS